MYKSTSLQSHNRRFDTIRSKLVMKVYDEYVNVLRGMYIVRFNGGASSQENTSPVGPLRDHVPFINTVETWYSYKVRKHKEREEKQRV